MSDLQFEISFSSSLPPEAQLGMAIAYENANELWRTIWEYCVWEAARRLEFLTVDDVLHQLELVNEKRKAENKPLIETHNESAIGPCMKAAADKGIIVATGERRRSKRPKKHGNLHQVWRSNFCAKTPSLSS